jgi:hypothetical protein
VLERQEGGIRIHPPAAEGDFQNESGNVLRPRVIQDYDTNIGNADKGDNVCHLCSKGVQISQTIFALFTTANIKDVEESTEQKCTSIL